MAIRARFETKHKFQTKINASFFWSENRLVELNAPTTFCDATRLSMIDATGLSMIDAI